jgi:hypothetical protein
LWAYKTALKNPMGMSPYKMVYVKSSHLPSELEYETYWVVRQWNIYNVKTAGKKRMPDLHLLDEWRNEANEYAKLFKEKVNFWHDKKI